MFDQLFERSHAIKRQTSSPLVAERLRYLQHLAEGGAARSTLRVVAIYLVHIAERLHLADRRGELLRVAEIEREAGHWAQRHSTSDAGTRYSRQRFLWNATQWLDFLGWLQQRAVPPGRCAHLVIEFADYMEKERGLSVETIKSRCSALQQFLEQLGATEVSLRKLDARHIDAVLVERLTRGEYARVSIQTYANTLRAFFRYAEARGWCRAGLAGSIHAPRCFSQDRLPGGPSWEEVQRVLAATRGTGPASIRDHALLMLLAVYGLRRGEVVRLRLEDFDWAEELLTVRRSKIRQVRTYPLCRPVGDAILRYLKRARPRTACREVFTTLRAPIRPLRRSALTALVMRHLHELGTPLAHYGPHALRHACATHLLRRGLSLKEIGDHLGHRHPDTTRIYAKVDLAGLRKVAAFDLGGLQ
jgi:integrase/recombinase XerD